MGGVELSIREREHIRKVIEEWNPFCFEESVYGIESYEIYKCIKARNNNDPISQEHIALYIQKILMGYAAEMNEEVNLEMDECLKIAQKIACGIDQ
jgi:hypothetical protein